MSERIQRKTEAILFHLDGVVVFTDKYHYRAWKELSDENGWFFSEEINDDCRGVPRMESLEVILRYNNVELSDEKKAALADRKNRRYVELLQGIGEDDIYPGVVSFLEELRESGLKIGLCSSSRNAKLVLENLDLTRFFDAVVTGDEIVKAKPNPEIFLTGASRLGVEPDACVVFEDAPAGIDAALAAGMKCVGVGFSTLLGAAPFSVKEYREINLQSLIQTGSADASIMNRNCHTATEWTLEEASFDRDRIVLNGNKYILGNGYMGYRGTLEEFRAEELVGNMIAGLYDKVGDGWREPVNAPNALFTRLHHNGIALGVLESSVESHRQTLDIREGCHRRKTVFVAEDGTRIAFAAERFLSLDNRHLMAMEFSVQTDRPASLEIETGIDLAIWDINGPHLESLRVNRKAGMLCVDANTQELGCKISIAEALVYDGFEAGEKLAIQGSQRTLSLTAEAGRTYRFRKYVAVYTGADGVGSVPEAARTACAMARTAGYEALRESHAAAWERYWNEADVQIDGDVEAQFAVRYSLYHFLAIAPPPEKSLSIPARGLSGQVYKGAIFWDTEMFMAPFFNSVLPGIARSLLLYRYNTLEGARRKAREYGYEGAFYAWESQETGDDACTHFNVTDVFTGRPIRTYFRDKQIHISAAVAYAFWKYYTQTGDEGIFLEGGAEVVFECARFFHFYAYYKEPKHRYEFLDVVGPDEYHDRVCNNAYTNRMVLETFHIARSVTELLEKENPEFLSRLVDRLGFAQLRAELPKLTGETYMPVPDAVTGIIEQFDGYMKLDDVPMAALKKRIINPNEYLGGGNGLATTTQILKQADVVLMLSLFGDDYTQEIKRRNWLYYEPRTEHGSSLSACAYALVACEIGEKERAYEFFLQTATVDLTGKSKQYVGTLYIGGTHPAANGGAWLVAVKGFAGLRVDADGLTLDPKLPKEWRKLCFCVHWHGQRFSVTIVPDEIAITSDPKNTMRVAWRIGGAPKNCSPGSTITHPIKDPVFSPVS
jgi:beta-phosphoglucomutase